MVNHKNVNHQPSRQNAVIFVMAILATMLMAGCVMTTSYQNEISETISAEGVDQSSVEIILGAGELFITGGSDDLFEGVFQFNDVEPVITFNNSDGIGHLEIEQKQKGFNIGKNEGVNHWDLKLNDQLSTELYIKTGASASKIDLSTLNLTSLDIELGVGDTQIDLSGDYEQNFDVKIDAGVGNAKIIFPEHIGVKVKTTTGIGTVNAKGFTKKGSDYVNEAYGSTDMNINVEIIMGVGNIDLVIN